MVVGGTFSGYGYRDSRSIRKSRFLGNVLERSASQLSSSISAARCTMSSSSSNSVELTFRYIGPATESARPTQRQGFF